MPGQEPASFDLQTVSLMREALDDAWASLPLQRRASLSRTLLAERILAEAARGERNPVRLVDAALTAVAA